jgi:aldose 1-epimerase
MAGEPDQPVLTVEIGAGDYRLVAAPDLGGSILRFDWRGEPIMRPVPDPSSLPSILDAACFPLVPFSNRIAHGEFSTGERSIRLRPNFPGSDHPHPLHGFGWLAPWTVMRHDPHELVMEHRHPAGEWPWSYRAEQRFVLDADGLTMGLAVTNQGDGPMPLGLGFHPYFVRDESTRYRGLHRGEWRNDAECIPLSHDEREAPRDWWEGSPVGRRSVDTVYTGRAGSLEIVWPERLIRLALDCSDLLAHTVLYTPAGEDFFCVEPVTNETDAFNRGRLDLLAPGAARGVQVRLSCSPL